jgi:hypothetical protein
MNCEHRRIWTHHQNCWPHANWSIADSTTLLKNESRLLHLNSSRIVNSSEPNAHSVASMNLSAERKSSRGKHTNVVNKSSPAQSTNSFVVSKKPHVVSRKTSAENMTFRELLQNHSRERGVLEHNAKTPHYAESPYSSSNCFSLPARPFAFQREEPNDVLPFVAGVQPGRISSLGLTLPPGPILFPAQLFAQLEAAELLGAQNYLGPNGVRSHSALNDAR